MKAKQYHGKNGRLEHDRIDERPIFELVSDMKKLCDQHDLCQGQCIDKSKPLMVNQALVFNRHSPDSGWFHPPFCSPDNIGSGSARRFTPILLDRLPENLNDLDPIKICDKFHGKFEPA